MKSKKGWICIHRDIVDHWIYQESEALKVWLTLLIEANHEKKTHMFNGAMTTIQRGQLVCGRHSLAEKTGVSENKIRRYIGLLESEGMINQQKTNKYSVITIANYAEYQNVHQQSTGKTPADNQQTTTPKQLNKLINKKYGDLDFAAWDEVPSIQVLEDWIAMRKTKRAPVSQTVVNKFCPEINLAFRSGYTPDDCLSLCVLKGWQGFKFQWLKNEESQNGNRNQPARQTPGDKTSIAADLAFGSAGSGEILEGDFDRVDPYAPAH